MTELNASRLAEDRRGMHFAHETENLRAQLEYAAARCVAELEAHSGNGPAILSSRQLPVDATGLRDCVTSYVSALKALGYAPEITIRETKALIAAAARRNSDLRLLVDAVVTWAIHSYYAE